MIVHRLHNSVVYRTLPLCLVIICIHDAAFSMHNSAELSANMHLMYKLLAMHNFRMFLSKSQFFDIVTI